MIITLTPSEVDLINSLRNSPDTQEDVIHRLLAPMVKERNEDRLQVLANTYRSLTPDLQIEALATLKAWLLSKTL